jgi:hypothetical protein
MLYPINNILPIDTSLYELGTINGSDGANLVNGARLRLINPLTVFPGRKYRLDLSEAPSGFMAEVYFYNVTTFVSKFNAWSIGPIDFTVPVGVTGVRFSLKHTSDRTLSLNEITANKPKLYDMEKLGQKPAILYPAKNIFPPLNNERALPAGYSSWVLGGNAQIVSTTDRELTLNFPNTGAGTYSCYVPVEPGKNYTFSLENGEGYGKCRLRIARGSNQVLINSTGIYDKTKTITVPSNETSLFLTIDNNNEKGGNTQGTFTFKEVQVEKSDTKTPYEPYAAENKPATVYADEKSNLLDISRSDWAIGSADASWNLTGSITRLRLNNKIKVKPGTLYTLKITPGYQIYIRQFAKDSGVNEVGTSTWYDDGKQLTSEPTANYWGIILRKNDDSPIVVSDLPIIKPMIAEGAQTEYKPYKLINKPANLQTDQNLLPPLFDPKWYLQPGQAKGVIAGGYKYVMDAPTDVVYGYDFPITLTPGKIYTLSAVFTGSNARLRIIKKSNSAFIANLTASGSTTFTATNDNDIVLRVENNGKAGLNIVESFQLVEGAIAPPFKEQKLINKPAVLYPGKNLVPPFNDKAWTLFSNVDITNPYKLITRGSGNWDVSKVVVPVIPGIPFTLSAKVTGTGSVEIWEDGVINLGSFSKDVNIAGGFAARTYTPTRTTAEIRIVNSKKEYTDLIFEELQLEQTASKTPFEPYKLGNKPL